MSGSRMIFTEPEYRVEGPLKVTGAAQYTADVAMPGMLWLAYTRSTHAHALLKGVETRAAQAVPGVHAVLTGADTGNVRLGRRLLDWPILATDRVRMVGDRVAAVAAETREAAEAAARLVDIEYALADGAPILHPTSIRTSSSARSARTRRIPTSTATP